MAFTARLKGVVLLRISTTTIRTNRLTFLSRVTRLIHPFIQPKKNQQSCNGVTISTLNPSGYCALFTKNRAGESLVKISLTESLSQVTDARWRMSAETCKAVSSSLWGSRIHTASPENSKIIHMSMQYLKWVRRNPQPQSYAWTTCRLYRFSAT
jgi:hypothetical protein